jgi:glucose/arabinose dehydrogenase
MPHPVREIPAASAIVSFAAIVAFAAIIAFAAVPLLAQTGAGLLEGTAAFGDWHGDHPGVRRIIRPQDLGPQDLPAPNTAESARNFVREVRRTDQKPIVPNGFEVNLFASGLAEPRNIRAAPNGDVFVAESSAGRIRVLRPDGGGAAQGRIFASGLRYPFGIAFYPAGPEPQWVYVGNTDAVVRFPYRNGDRIARGRAEVVVPHLPVGGHSTRDVVLAGRQDNVCRSAPDRTPAKAWRS